MKKSTLIAFTIIFSAFANAEIDRVGSALTSKLDDASFRANLQDGYHFNEAAPNHLQTDAKWVKPEKSSAHELVFHVSNVAFKSARATLYVCDDALTFCEPRSIDLKSAKNGEADISEARAPEPKLVEKNSENKSVTKNEFGFIEDNLQAAADQAEREHKLVLIDFSARWCPGCIRLENEIFGTKAFKSAAKKFITVRLDYDRFENLKIAKQYDIRGIPSLLVTTPKLEEISRSVDFQPMTAIASFLADAKTNSLPYAEFQKKADAGDKKAMLILGRRYYTSSQYAKSVEYLSKVKPEPIELADAKVQVAKALVKVNEKLKPEFEKTLRDAIQKEPASSRSVLWRNDLVDLVSDSAEKKKIALEGLAVVDSILANPKKIKEALKGDPVGEFSGYESMYVASEGADLAETANLDEAAQQSARLKVTDLGRAANIPIARKGPSLRYLIFLVAAKQYSEAEAQVTAMLKDDSKNPELIRRHLRILNGLEKYKEAITVGRELLPLSFGKNEVWVAQQLIKAYLGAGEKAEARVLAQTYLAKKEIDWSMMKTEQKDLTQTANL